MVDDKQDNQGLVRDEDFGIEGPGQETIPASSVGGNGHAPDHNITREQEEAFEEDESEKAIPGKGHLFHVKRKHLHESTRLNKKMIWSFAIGDVKQLIFTRDREDSVFDALKFGIMGYEISDEGKGRDESIILHRLTAEENKSAADGGAFGRPG